MYMSVKSAGQGEEKYPSMSCGEQSPVVSVGVGCPVLHALESEFLGK